MNPQIKKYLDNLDSNRNNHTRLTPDTNGLYNKYGRVFYEEKFDRMEFIAELERYIQEEKIIGDLPEVKALFRINKSILAYKTKVDNTIETIIKRSQIEKCIETSYTPINEIENCELRSRFTSKELSSTADNISILKQNCTHLTYTVTGKQHSLDSWAEIAESKKENRIVTTLEFYKHKPSSSKHNQTQM